MFKRILVPLDGSEIAEKVLPTVLAEAKLHEAVVVLLRVIAPLRQTLMSSPSLIKQVFNELDQIAHTYLDNVAEEFRTAGLEVEMIIIRGSPALLTVEIAHEESCDLIILGTHGETNTPQWRLGSVANKIIRTPSPIPIMLIPT